MDSSQTRRPSIISLNCLLAALVMSAFSCSGRAGAEEIETKDGGVPVIRLSSKAGDKGWIGRRPRQKRSAAKKDAVGPRPEASLITSPRLQHLNNPLSPPPAPPTDPDEPLPRTRRLNIHTQKAPAITPVRPNPSVMEPEPAGIQQGQTEGSKTVRLMKLVSQSGSSKKANKEPAADTDKIRTRPPMLLTDLDVSRPVRDISLSASIRSVNMQGDELRQPEDHAAAIFEQFGVYHDLPVFQGDGQGWCCAFPIFYNPLYFEDPNMERCGQGYGCFTEAASIVRFFGRIPIVPYLKGSNPPCTCVRSLGNCPACHRYGMDAYIPPLNVPGVAAQAAATVALVFLVP